MELTRPTTLKLHDFSDESFIHGCYIPDRICDDLIKYFDEHPDRQAIGKIYDVNRKKSIEDVSKKESIEIGFYVYEDEEDARLLSEYLVYLNLCIREYEYKYDRARLMSSYGITEGINLQKYEPGGGYKNWHADRCGSADESRCLVFMTYLNNVSEGGTEFMYQKITSPAKKGLTIIWPTDWTHTHKGQISQTHKKYILTGWLNYTK